MFIEYLSERQQSALLHYAYKMMRADKRIEAEEQLLIETLRAQTLPSVEAEDVALADLGDLFEDRLTRMALLLELVGIGYVDDSFNPSESAPGRGKTRPLEASCIGVFVLRLLLLWSTLAYTSVEDASLPSKTMGTSRSKNLISS